MEISRNWATAYSLTFYGWPQNCHSICAVCLLFSTLMYYSEGQSLLEVESSTILGLVGSNQFLPYP